MNTKRLESLALVSVGWADASITVSYRETLHLGSEEWTEEVTKTCYHPPMQELTKLRNLARFTLLRSAGLPGVIDEMANRMTLALCSAKGAAAKKANEATEKSIIAVLEEMHESILPKANVKSLNYDGTKIKVTGSVNGARPVGCVGYIIEDDEETLGKPLMDYWRELTLQALSYAIDHKTPQLELGLTKEAV